MKRSYYFLVSSLVDYQFDSDAKGLKLLEVREEIASHLSRSDSELLTLIYWLYDINNIIAQKSGRSGSLSPLGNLSSQRVEQLISYMELQRPTDEDEEAVEGIPSFVKGVVDIFKLSAEPSDDEQVAESLEMGFERSLYESYYSYVEKKGGDFLKEWFVFDRDLRNVCAAFSARGAGREIEPEIVGGGEIASALVRSALPDFGLKGEIDYIDSLMSAIDSDNIVDKERKIDLIRWKMIDEINTFDYFNSGFVFGYMLKLGILYRWIALDREQGREFFNKLVASLSDKKLLEVE